MGIAAREKYSDALRDERRKHVTICGGLFETKRKIVRGRGKNTDARAFRKRGVDDADKRTPARLSLMMRHQGGTKSFAKRVNGAQRTRVNANGARCLRRDQSELHAPARNVRRRSQALNVPVRPRRTRVDEVERDIAADIRKSGHSSLFGRDGSLPVDLINPHQQNTK